VSPGGRHLVLVGAGHAHVQVLEAWSGGTPDGVRITVVVDRPVSLYSGMVPGMVEGRYRREELAIPVAPLAEAVGAELVVESLASVDPHGRRILLGDGRTLAYDVLSLNIGSTVAGGDVPGVREHAVATRPLSRLLDAVDRLGEEGGDGPAVVVGGGAAGVELAAALRARLGKRAEVTLVEGGPALLPDRPPRVSERVRSALEERGVRVRLDAPVVAVEGGGVRLAGEGGTVASALTVWAAGAAPPPPVAASPLPVDGRGYVRIRPTLQVDAHPDIFAVGDCASLRGERLPRAGVYAVRQGPVLRENLEAWLAGERPRPWEPQGDFLALLNLGDGHAMAVKWGRAVVGRWVMWLKDRIDRRFVARFRR
jgi:selenide,water dikinase